MNAAEASLRMEKPEQARKYLDSCKRVWQKSQESYDLGCMCYIEGMVETADSNFDRAIEAFARSLDLLEDSDHRFQVGRIYHEYGKMYLKKGDKETAKENLKEAVRILDEYNIVDELKAVYHTLEDIEP